MHMFQMANKKYLLNDAYFFIYLPKVTFKIISVIKNMNLLFKVESEQRRKHLKKVYLFYFQCSV